MRKIGELSSEVQAGVFSAALRVREMGNDVESEDDGTFSIWVHDDDRLPAASALLEQFRAAPDAPEWYAAVPAAKRMQKDEERRDARRASHVITRERMGYERNYGGFAMIPLILGAISILVTIFAAGLEFQLMPGSTEAKRMEMRNDYLFITRWGFPPELKQELLGIEQKLNSGAASRAEKDYFEKELARFESGEPWDASLPEVRSGQVWRLITPIFIHFGIIHILFNMMWLRDLGSFVQTRFGGAYLLVFVLASAVVSNLVQFYLAGPSFGGMSGVNYALFGFLWLRGKYDRTAVWRLNPTIVQTMLIWFVLCFTGIFGGIANGAHAAGLVFGAVAGFVTGKRASKGLH